MSWASLSMHSKTLRFTRWPHGSRSFTTRFLLFAKEISYATIKHCFLAFNSVFFVYMCKGTALIRIVSSLSLFKGCKNSFLFWFYYPTGCFLVYRCFRALHKYDNALVVAPQLMNYRLPSNRESGWESLRGTDPEQSPRIPEIFSQI